MLPPSGGLACPSLFCKAKLCEVRKVGRCSWPCSDGPWIPVANSECSLPGSVWLLPLEQELSHSPQALHGCICAFALVLMELLLPRWLLHPEWAPESHGCVPSALQSRFSLRVAAAITGFHPVRGASLLIARVMLSGGTHRTESLIQRAALGARSGSSICHPSLTQP